MGRKTQLFSLETVAKAVKGDTISLSPNPVNGKLAVAATGKKRTLWIVPYLRMEPGIFKSEIDSEGRLKVEYLGDLKTNGPIRDPDYLYELVTGEVSRLKG